LKIKLSDGQTTLDVNFDFVFGIDQVIGTMKAPVVLNLRRLSLNEMYFSEVQIYPNPFSESVTVVSQDQSDSLTRIQIYSIRGSLIMEKEVSTNQTTLSTTHLASGIYLMKLTTKTGHQSFKKLVKR
jgi:hypothetical protein